MKKRGLFLTTPPLREAKAHVHSLLENELSEIRQCLAQLEERLQDNLMEISGSPEHETRAA